jgi:[ribosomal protein S5]-alanine N-acetyltransferase
LIKVRDLTTMSCMQPVQRQNRLRKQYMGCMIQTDRLRMRDFEADDIEHVRTLSRNENVMRYLMVWLDTEEQIQTFFNEGMNTAGNDNRTLYLLSVEIKETCAYAGIALIEIDEHSRSSAEIGYILLEEYWGKGFATEIARVLTQYGFSELKMHRVYAKCDALNKASANVLEKIGMTYEGSLRQHVWLRDHWRTSKLYGMLEEEFIKASE